MGAPSWHEGGAAPAFVVSFELFHYRSHNGRKPYDDSDPFENRNPHNTNP